MSEIKPKKERRFLKTLGRVGEILVEQVLLKLGSSIIKKIGGKKTLPSILFLFLSLSLFAQFPNTLNKQRLGFQTTADGLAWRGSISDTASIQPVNNQNAWVILDTINLKFYTFDFTSNVWNLVGGAAFTQPVDSLFFNVNVPTNNVDTAKMRWDSDLATVVLGLNDNVPNEIGFKNFWLVKNQTGSTITKGSLVYANGTVGASGRITVDKFIANGSIDAKYLLGITAHDLTDGEDGYVISFGKIRQVNTDTFAAGAILYPSPTVAGVWTDVEPIAPNIDMPIGFCVNSSSNNGTIAIRVASGYRLNELHDVGILSPVEKASLYYSAGLWRDTTTALLVSDTASMLLPYFRDADTSSLNLTSRFATKLNLSDTASMLTPYFMDADTSLLNLTSRFAAKLNISDTASMLTPYLRKLDTISLSNRINTKLNLSDTSNMLLPYLRKADTTNMLLPYFRDADTTSLNLTSRFNTKVNLSDTSNMLVPYLRKADTTNMLLPYFRDADTTSLNLTSRFNTKLNLSDTLNMLVPYLRKADTTNMLLPYFRDADTSLLNLTSRFAAKQNNLTNPVTGTGTNNFVPKFTTTGSTIGNSTIQDNGTTVSTSSILSTTNYVALDAGNNTHRLTNTLSQNQTWIAPSGFITSFFNANTSGGWYFNDTLSNSGYPILSILSKSNDRKKTGITLNSQDTAIGTYTPAITFSSLSNSGQYYSAYAAILGKKTGTGNSSFPDNLPDNNWNSGHLEFYGTTQATGSLGGIMRNPNMVLGNGVGIGYDAPPTVRGRLTVLEKLGINQSTPAFALDVSGTANITGATTLGSTLAVTGDITENGNNVLTSADTSAFARDNQISGTSGQVAYFNSSNSVISDAGLIYNATNKSLGINTTTTSGANLIIKNSQEPSRATVVATQTFAADTTNWTRGTGWTFNGTQAVATAATGNLTYTPALTITSGNAYEIRYTLTNYSAGTLTVALGNVSLALPTNNATANVILLSPTSATGGFRFTTSTFTGNVNNVSVVEISNAAPVIFAGQDDGSSTLYNSLRMPNSTTFAIGGGGSYTTGTNNLGIGANSLFLNTSGAGNTANGVFALRSNTTGNNNVAMGTNSLRFSTSANDNIAIGANALFTNTIGSNNVANGTSALQSNTTGGSNIGIGINALFTNTVGSNNIGIGANVGDNIELAANGNVIIGNGIDLPISSGSNQVAIKNIIFATGASGAGTTIAALSKAGIKTNAPNRDLEVAGEVRITDLTTDTPTRLVGADSDGDLGQVTLGSTLSLTGSSLGVTSNTFLPLTGGTLTGGFSVATTGVPFTANSTNANTNKIGLSDNGIIRSYLGANNAKLFTVANLSTTEFYNIDTNGVNNIFALGVPLNINSLNSNINKIALYDNGSITGYIASSAAKPFVVNDNSSNEVFYVTDLGSANFTGNITEAGNNVLTNLDTASLSSRIDSKFNSSGGTISGKAILNDSARFEGNVLFKKNMGLPIVKISNADYTATTSNHTIIYTVLTADKTLTIPNASDAIGIKYIISIFDIPEGNEALTLVTPSSNLFVRTDGESSNVDIVGGYCTTIQSDGTKWYILSYAPMY